MRFLNLNKNKALKSALITLYLFFCTSPMLYAANSAYDELDSLRANLSLLNKNSNDYTKIEQKLNKLVIKNNIDYTPDARFVDVERLIKECKYDAAIYEINALIALNYKTSKCSEYLGDIAYKIDKNPSLVAKHYKDALSIDSQNISARYKLSKLYFREKRNILGIENLKIVALNSDNKNLLDEIEYIILYNISPCDKYEANNLYEILGIIYERQNKYPDTYKAYKRAIELNKTDLFLKYHLADLYLNNNKKSDALKVLDSILEDNKNDSQIRSTKAQILENDGNLYEAAKEYLEILKQYPNSAYAKYQIFKIYKGKETPKNILKIINKNNPNFKDEKRDYELFADFLNNMGDTEGADLFFDYLKTLDNKQFQNAIVPQKTNKTQNQIINKKNKAQNINQNVKLPEAQLFGKKETKKEAKEENKVQQVQKQQTPKQQQVKKEPQKQTQTQKTLQSKNQPQKQTNKQLQSQKQQKPVIKKQDDKKMIENKIAQERKNAINKNSKKYYEHKRTLDKYLAINPKDKLTYVAIANTYKLMGEYTNAILNYQNALKLDAADSDIYFNIALANLELSDLDNSKLYLEKADKLNHDDSKVQNMLAFVNQKIITRILNNSYEKYEAKDYVSAFQILDNGIKKFPNYAQMYYYRALVYDAMNRNAAQISDLEKAIELDPGYYMSYYQLGRAYEKIRDERSALVAYERFLSTEPDEKELVSEVEKKVLSLGNKYY